MDPGVTHTLYSQELRTAYPDRWFPVANPQPGLVSPDGPSLPRVRIGDVGYIHPNQGNFVTLFNVHKVLGEAGQPGPEDLPADFVPLDPVLANRRNIVPDHNTIFKMDSVIVKGGKAKVQGPVLNALSAGGSIEFTTSQSRGALLLTPGRRPIMCIDASPTDHGRYWKYAEKSLESWCDFFEERRLGSFDIFLVTGVHRTSSWETAAVASSKLQVEFGINVDLQTVGGVELAPKLSWVYSPAVMTNSGRSSVQTGADQDSQTVFIRWFLFRRRMNPLWASYKMKAEAGDWKPDVDEDDSAGGTGAAKDSSEQSIRHDAVTRLGPDIFQRREKPSIHVSLSPLTTSSLREMSFVKRLFLTFRYGRGVRVQGHMRAAGGTAKTCIVCIQYIWAIPRAGP